MRLLPRNFAVLFLIAAAVWAQPDAQLRFCIRHDPKTFDPVLLDGESEESIRYLTGGVLMRVNRSTQKLEPELATAWKISDGGKKITFRLREGLRFSDGSPFSAEDVAFTMKRLLDPQVHSPTGDAFRSGIGEIRTTVENPNQLSVLFPAPVAALDRLFDQVAILSAKSPKKEMAVLGPYAVAEYKSGSYVLLRRNPYYWKKDSSGRRLPYLESIRLDIQSNRDIEMLRFKRGEIHMITGLDADTFDRLHNENPRAAIDAGASFDSEMMWFNQVRSAPIPAYKKTWFQSQAFRRAVSAAVNRSDIARLVYKGYAQPAAGPYSSKNRLWFNSKLKPQAYSPSEALHNLKKEGFRLENDRLLDRAGNPVEFSLITNSGNKARAKIASLVQQDLAKLGIRLNVVPLDFPSLIERINRTFAYEACLLGLVNVDPDPNGQMNVWLSSAANHQWNPNQKSPETPWEAEIDKLMRAQASTVDLDKRRASFNRVQEIASEQVPFIYLVTKNSLLAVTPDLQGVSPTALRPQLFWNAERLSFSGSLRSSR